MPCIDCDNGIEICGPDATQGDCEEFDGVFLQDTSSEEKKCPDGWCLERTCTEDGVKYSIWHPTTGCLKHAYTPYRKWHRNCDRCGDT